MKLGDEGDDVRRLQLALMARGYSLPRFGADADFGRETAAAVRLFAAEAGLLWSSSQPIPDAMLDQLDLEDEPVVVLPTCEGELDLEGVRVYDLRHEQVNPHPKGKTRGGRTVMRSPKQITAITLHQAGIDFADRTTEIDTARRGLRAACHAMAFEGFLALTADPLMYINHANNLNSRSLGLEVDGLYPGVIGGKVPKGKKATAMLDETIHAACMGMKLLLEIGRRLGCPIEFIFGHRQGDSWRRADPCEWLWREVTLGYAVPVLGLKTCPRESFPNVKGDSRHGLPIPTRWDPDGVGPY